MWIELRPGAVGNESADQAISQVLAVTQQAIEGHAAGNGAVVEEDAQGAAGWQTHQVGHARIDGTTAQVAPGASTSGQRTDSPGLVRGQNGEVQALFGQGFESVQIDGGFGEPHALRETAETALEIADAPDDLGGAIAAVGQGQNHVVVDLGQSRAMAGKTKPAFAIGGQDGGVGLGIGTFQPGQERGAEIEAYAREIIDNTGDSIVTVEDAGCGIGSVALRRDPFVPVVVRIGRVLDLDGFQPGILPRRLIKMTVNANVQFHETALWADDALLPDLVDS